jgi:subtilisin family serine protease
MPDGKHCQCGGDAGDCFVIRRSLALCVATACASVLVLPQPSVSASSEPAPFTEEIARTRVTSSPQTAGPEGGALSWGLDRIDQRTAISSPASYDFSEDGGDVTAYILDSGVNASHPEFGNRVKEGWSYRASSTALANYRSALAAYATDPNTGIRPCANDGSYAVDPTTFDNPGTIDTADKGMADNDGHGTHVAGIVGGDTTGVAKGVTIVPVRSLDSCGNGTRTMILEALTWIQNHHVTGQKAVLNLSIGFDSQVASVDNKITELMNKGIVVIAAAGNDAISACGTTPASTSGTISVGSSANDTSVTPFVDRESFFSNYGLCVDIFSPGSSIRSTYPFLSGVTNTYATQSGTSMAAPFVSGAVARYLQVLDVGPTNFATGPTAAWTWLRDNATLNAVTYFNNARTSQTANRLLYVPASSVRVEQLQVTSAVNSAVVSWQNPQPNTTYVARALPGNASCTAIATSTCTITGLVGGTSYVISTVASNVSGKGAASTTVTPLTPPPPVVVPPPVVIPPPTTPAETFVAVASRALTLTWSSVSSSLPVTYVVTNSDGATVCTTTETGCVVQGLLNGKEYSFTVAAQTSSGTSSATPTIVARPGFRVIKTMAARKSQPLLSSFVRSVSTGKRTWSESGPCSIKGTRLVTPKKKSTCVITLRVAKTKTYPAMSTRVTIVVS